MNNRRRFQLMYIATTAKPVNNITFLFENGCVFIVSDYPVASTVKCFVQTPLCDEYLTIPVNHTISDDYLVDSSATAEILGIAINDETVFFGTHTAEDETYIYKCGAALQ